MSQFPYLRNEDSEESISRKQWRWVCLLICVICLIFTNWDILLNIILTLWIYTEKTGMFQKHFLPRFNHVTLDVYSLNTRRAPRPIYNRALGILQCSELFWEIRRCPDFLTPQFLTQCSILTDPQRELIDKPLHITGVKRRRKPYIYFTETQSPS